MKSLAISKEEDDNQTRYHPKAVYLSSALNMGTDLSDYEQLRLRNITENAQIMNSLGLGGLGIKINSSSSKTKTKTISTVKKKKRARGGETKVFRAGTRSSKRIKGIKAKDDETESPILLDKEEDHPTIDYSNIHLTDSNELDDHEFLVYSSLRNYRLRRKNELDIEPYKICQNRTLFELIRRRRNDPKYATEKIESDLLDCWGIGPSKAKADGFGPELLEVLNSKENTHHLEVSRKSAVVNESD